MSFKKPDHEASMSLSFNPAFILEFYITGTQELVALCLLFCIFPVFLVFFLYSSLFSQNETLNGFKDFSMFSGLSLCNGK